MPTDYRPFRDDNDLRRLCMFDNVSLLHTLAHRRWMRAEQERRYGYASFEHRDALAGIGRVVGELQSRGMRIPDAGHELSA